MPSTSASPANAAIRASSRVPITRNAEDLEEERSADQDDRHRDMEKQKELVPGHHGSFSLGWAGDTILRLPDDAIRSDACVRV